MSYTNLRSSDRFLDDFLVCSCGLAAPERSLNNKEGRERVLNRFKANPGPQLPNRAEDTERSKFSPSQSAPIPAPSPMQIVHCPQCGAQLERSKARESDRFFDEYLECRCGALCLNQRERPAATEKISKPYSRDPNFEEIRKESQARSVPTPSAPPPREMLELWGDDYWVTFESDMPVKLGLPRYCSDTRVLAGPWKVEVTDPTYPVGFHAVLSGFCKSVPDLRYEIVSLYEQLLSLPFSGQRELRCHMLAPLDVFCKAVAKASVSKEPPFETLRIGRGIPGDAQYLTDYLTRLLHTPMVGRKGRFISLAELGTTPGFIEPSEIDVDEDGIDLFKHFYGAYRFRSRT